MRRSGKLKFVNKLARQRVSRLYRRPEQVRLLHILGATTLTLGFVRHKNTNFPLTIILSRGRLLRREHFKAISNNSTILLANDIRWAIALQGRNYENDVVSAYEYDEKLKEMGWVVRYIPERWLWQNPFKVRAEVTRFLS